MTFFCANLLPWLFFILFRPKQTHNYPKVPTCNLYGPGSKEILEWGYTAKVAITKPPFKNHVLLSKYKLHLDDASGPHPPLPNGLTVVDAIADYLRLFHAHVVQVRVNLLGSYLIVYFFLNEANEFYPHLSTLVCSQGLRRRIRTAAHSVLPFGPGHVDR